MKLEAVQQFLRVSGKQQHFFFPAFIPFHQIQFPITEQGEHKDEREGCGPEPKPRCSSPAASLLDNEPPRTDCYGALLCSSTRFSPCPRPVCLGISFFSFSTSCFSWNFCQSRSVHCSPSLTQGVASWPSCGFWISGLELHVSLQAAGLCQGGDVK